MYRELNQVLKSTVENMTLPRGQDGIHTDTHPGCKDVKGTLRNTFWVEKENTRSRYPFELSWSYGRVTPDAFNIYSTMQSAVSKVLGVLGEHKLNGGFISNGKS